MTETVVLVDLGGDAKALRDAIGAAARSGPRPKFIATEDPEIVSAADRIVLAGASGLAAAMKTLASRELVPALEHAVLAAERPFLGIGAGMLVLAEKDTRSQTGLNWIAGVARPDRAKAGERLVTARSAHPVLASLDHRPSPMYFAASDRFEAENDAHVLAKTGGEKPSPAVVGRDNLVGLAFRPERSGEAGQAILADFLQWRP